MKMLLSVARWGKNHKLITWIIFIVCLPLLAGIGFSTGAVFYAEGWVLPVFWRIPLLAVFFLIVLFYPVVPKLTRENFSRRKPFDLALLLTGILLFVHMGNQMALVGEAEDPKSPGFLASPQATFTAIKMLKPPEVSIDRFSLLQSESARKWVTNTARKVVEKWRLSERPGAAKKNKGLLIVLVILLSLALTFLLAGLACSLSCNGQEGLAYLVFFGGMALVIFLAVILIRNISEPPVDRLGAASTYRA